MQSKEQMLDLLLSAGLEAESKEIEANYNREISFSALGVSMRIEWWKNISYLFIGEIQIPFTKIDVGGTWPNRFALNINFSRSGEKVCIVPIKEY